MHALSLIVCAILAQASQPAASRPQDLLRVAVYDLDRAGVDPKLGRVASDNLLAEVRKLSGVHVIGMDEVRQMLDHEARKQLIGCDDESCLAEISGALGVDELLTGRLLSTGDEFVFMARRIDLKKATVKAVSQTRLAQGSAADFLAAVGPTVRDLFPDHALRPGEKRGVSPEVALRLNPPPVPLWAFIATASSSAAALLAGGALAGAWGLAVSDINDRYARAAVWDEEARRRELDGTALPLGVSALVAAGFGAVLAVGAGLLAISTDWHGYSDQAEEAR